MSIEQKALELVNAATNSRADDIEDFSRGELHQALCLALEAHEADKSRHAAELREQAERFSEAAGKAKELIEAGVGNRGVPRIHRAVFLEPFILAPVDPLVEAVKACGYVTLDAIEPEFAADLRAALDARGLAIVKKEAVNG